MNAKEKIVGGWHMDQKWRATSEFLCRGYKIHTSGITSILLYILLQFVGSSREEKCSEGEAMQALSACICKLGNFSIELSGFEIIYFTSEANTLVVDWR
jgi:hypothetical protein